MNATFVLPASAGMSLAAHTPEIRVVCAPRVSGDEPLKKATDAASRSCSPRQRG